MALFPSSAHSIIQLFFCNHRIHSMDKPLKSLYVSTAFISVTHRLRKNQSSTDMRGLLDATTSYLEVNTVCQ